MTGLATADTVQGVSYPTQHPATSIMTPLGVVEGEVLTCLEERGPTTLRRLVDELEWPAPLVTMGVGALIREGLAQGIRQGLEIVVQGCPQNGLEADP